MRKWLVVGIACGAGLAFAPAASAATWTQTSPEFFFPDFVGVGASSATNVWAVGENDADFETPVAERWNGSAWVGGPFIDKLRPNDGGLFGVTTLSATNTWAVGWQDTPKSGALVLHWTGKVWSVVATPVPAAGATRTLNGVSAVSASNIWAVGGVQNASGTFPLIEHYNGTSWSVVAAAAASTALTTVKAVTASNIWAAGGDVVEHYNGTSWSRVSVPVTPTTVLSQIARVPGTTHLWAVGKDTGPSPETPVAIYYNGTSWVARNPAATGELDGVAADTDNNVWASGVSADGSANLSAHWTASAWHVDHPAGLANGWVENMAKAPGSLQLFAVGSLLGGSGPFAAYLH